MSASSKKTMASSPGKFIRPADLFKMRRKSTNHIVLTPSNNSNSSNPGANISFHIRSSPLKFNQPNFSKISAAHHVEPQSPLKCLNNLTDPSPTKNLPTVLKNPFNQSVKRKLNLSPTKNPKSPVKRIRTFGIDEDANLEPPKMKRTSIESPNSKRCSRNDWSLKTKLRINFVDYCKNWNRSTTSTHKRLSNGQLQDSPSKLNDHTISVEAIKNAATVYQHPYLAWLPLYPRTVSEYDKTEKTDSTISFTKHSQITAMMLKDWCESLDDLTNLLTDGRCPYFYMCSDNYNVLFRQTPSSIPKKPFIQVFVSPFTYGMASEMDKLKIEYRYPNEAPRRAVLSTIAKENSQAFFGSSQSARVINLDDSISQDSKQAEKKVTASIDSGNYSDFSDEEDEPEEASQILEDFGLSQQDFPTLNSKPKGFTETDSNTQTRSSSNRPLAIIEGVDNLRKFIKFLKTNRLYTINNVGKFACIPPTLLSPHEFRLSTPQYPSVSVSQKIVGLSINKISPENGTPSNTASKSSIKTNSSSSNTFESSTANIGPSFVELKGAILPKLHKELHHLLAISSNSDHTCSSTALDSTKPFSTIQS